MHVSRSPLGGIARPALLLALVAAVLPLAAQAQQAAAGASTDGAWWPQGGGRTAIGLNIGRSEFRGPCGAGYSCDDQDRYVSLYGRTMSSDYWGSQLAYVDMGEVERGGGTTRARGINLSLLAKLPLAQTFGVFGKLGATYGHTRTSAAADSGLATGTENGFGASWGAGLSWDFSPRLSAVVEWDRFDFRFVGGRDALRTASLGLQYRY